MAPDTTHSPRRTISARDVGAWPFRDLETQTQHLQRFLLILVVVIGILPVSTTVVTDAGVERGHAQALAERIAAWVSAVHDERALASLEAHVRTAMEESQSTYASITDAAGRDILEIGSHRRAILPIRGSATAHGALGTLSVLVHLDERHVLARAARVCGVHLMVAAILALLVYLIPMRALRQAIREGEATHAHLRRSDRLSSLGLVYAGLAHEINNPLGVILARVQLMRDSTHRRGDDAEEMDNLDTVERQSKRIAQIVRGLLAFGRGTQTERRPTDLGHVLANCVNLLERPLAKNGVQVTTVVTGDLPRVLANADELEQVFVNLLTNARDAMPGGGTITVRSSRVGDHVIAEIEDSGTGIANDVMDRLFEPFFTTKDVGKGTGLGLSVSYGIVRAHGGDIEVENAPGAGALFRVLLPVHEVTT